jgi:hypothetical protein
MREEPKRLKSNDKNELESDLCETIIGTTNEKEGKTKNITCDRRTSWKCDLCKRWVCHLHFSTYYNNDKKSYHKDICQACEESKEKGGKKT